MNPEHDPRESREAPEQGWRFGIKSQPSERHPDHNEDAYLAMSEQGIFAVFDGIGGATGGSEAAAVTARDTLEQNLANLSTRLTTEELEERIVDTLLTANHNVDQLNQQH